MQNLNLGIAITVSKEIRTIRKLENRIQKYRLYSNFNKWTLDDKVKKLIDRLKVFKKILKTGEIKKGVYNKTISEKNYNRLRKHINRMKTLEEEWEKWTGKPWIGAITKKDRLLDIKLKTMEIGKRNARAKENQWKIRK